MEPSPDIVSLRETIASLEARFLQFSEIDKQRQSIAQKIASELKEKLEAKGCELQQIASERDARANQAEHAQQRVEELEQQLAVELKEKEEALKHAEDLMEQLGEKEAEASSVTEEAELTLLQLHQVQEELENYFLLSRHQSDLLSSYSNLQQKIAVLISQSSNSSTGE